MVVLNAYYNQDPIPSNILDFNTVFLAGPSPSDANHSYRAEFISALDKSPLEYVVFNPQSVDFDTTKGELYAKWELEAMQVTKVIVFGLNTDAGDRIGLTTRVEFGLVCNTRKNVVVYRPEDSYRTTYIRDRCLEYSIPIETTFEGAVSQVDKSVSNKVEVRDGKFNSTEVLVQDVDPIFLQCALLQAEKKNTQGAIYVFTPLFDGSYLPLLKQMNYQPFIQTPKYSIFYKWNNPTVPDKVPEAGTSIAGAVAILLTEDETECLLVKTTDWRFPGGAINRGELDIKGLQRELHEELNIELELDPKQSKLIGGYNEASARKYGQFLPEDPAVVMNDHFSIYLVYIKRDVNIRVDVDELSDAKWFSVQDIIENKVEGVNKFNADLLRNYKAKGLYLQCTQDRSNKCKF